jgi:hypothetical protein
MAVSGIAAALNSQSPLDQVSLASGHHHRRGGVHPPSISDIDAQSSSVSSGGSPGKVGSKVDISV